MSRAALSKTPTHVVIGGGTAGCVLASRLSEDPHNEVLLIEGGKDFAPSKTPKDILSGYAGYAWANPEYYWSNLKFRRRPDAEAEYFEQARVIGGGSSINGQVSLRGAPSDFDGWERLGAAGWNWSSVLPYFLKIENDLDFDGPLHGNGGPIKIRRIPRTHWDDFTLAVSRAWESRGLADLRDLNGIFADGYGAIPSANDGITRYSAALAYLHEGVRRRSNLRIRDRTHVHNLIVKNNKVVGVAVSGYDGTKERLAGGCFILAAGAIRSPMLLMLSGIGPAQHLESHGIRVLADRPGVGAGLQDHPAITVSAYLAKNVRPAQGQRRNYTYLRYSSGHSGCRSSDMVMAAVYRSAWHAIGQRVATLSTFMGQAFSRGYVRLVSADPLVEPDVCFNHLVDVRDRERMMDAVRFMAELFASDEVREVTSDVFPSKLSERVKKLSERTVRNNVLTQCGALLMDMVPMVRRRIIGSILADGMTIDQLLSDARALESYVMDAVITGYHPAGTCRMGDPNNAMTVVDGRASVLGVDDLLVVDASIMPELPRTNINLPTIMVAERVAAMLCGRELTGSQSNEAARAGNEPAPGRHDAIA